MLEALGVVAPRIGKRPPPTVDEMRAFHRPQQQQQQWQQQQEARQRLSVGRQDVPAPAAEKAAALAEENQRLHDATLTVVDEYVARLQGLRERMIDAQPAPTHIREPFFSGGMDNAPQEAPQEEELTWRPRPKEPPAALAERQVFAPSAAPWVPMDTPFGGGIPHRGNSW